MARFEMEDGGKKKFFEIELNGLECTTRWGNEGQAPTVAVKKFTTEADAQKHIDKQVKERVKRGFAMVGLPPPAEIPAKELATHLKNIAKDPSSEAAYLVLADWLQTLDHPWGQLITVQHAAEKETAAKKKKDLNDESARLLAQNAVGVQELEKAGAKLSWRWGFLQSASVRGSTGEELVKAAKALLKLPAAKVLTQLVFDAQPAQMNTVRDAESYEENMIDPWADVLKSLGALLPKTVKSVSLGASPPVDGTGYATMPDFGAASSALADVEEVEIAGSPTEKVKPLNLPAARRVEVRFSEVNGAALTALAKSKLPKVERFSVWLGGNVNSILDELYEPAEWDEEDEDADRYPATYPTSDLAKLDTYGISEPTAIAQPLATFLAGVPKQVKELGIQSAVLNPDIVAAILGAPILPKLERLDLSGSSLGEEGADALVKGAKKLEHLQALDLRRIRLPEKAGPKLKKLKNVLVDEGKDAKDSSDTDFFMRFVAVME